METIRYGIFGLEQVVRVIGDVLKSKSCEGVSYGLRLQSLD